MLAADDALLAQQRHRVRRAILIGEADYRPRLPGTLKDVDMMYAALTQDMGFKPQNIQVLKDASREDMVSALETLEGLLRCGEGNDVILFYFTGHGGESDGDNFLFDINSKPLRLNPDVLQRLNRVATNAIIIVILDTCRYNPQNDTWADREKGIDDAAARFVKNASNAAPGSSNNQFCLFYACDPGHFAYSNCNGGYFTAALLQHMRQPLLLEVLGKRVTAALKREQRPLPWLNMGRFTDDFSLSWSKLVPDADYAGSQASSAPSSRPGSRPGSSSVPASEWNGAATISAASSPQTPQVPSHFAPQTGFIQGCNPDLDLVALGCRGSCFIRLKTRRAWMNLPQNLVTELKQHSGRRLRHLSFSNTSGDWAVVYEDNGWCATVPALNNAMREWRDRGPGYDIDKVFLGPGSTYIYKAVVRKGNKVTWHDYGNIAYDPLHGFLHNLRADPNATVLSAVLWGNKNYWLLIGNKAGDGRATWRNWSISGGTPAATAFALEEGRSCDFVVGSPDEDNATFMKHNDGRWWLWGPHDLLRNFERTLARIST